jgi:hypothetical protein
MNHKSALSCWGEICIISKSPFIVSLRSAIRRVVVADIDYGNGTSVEVPDNQSGKRMSLYASYESQ